jgi:hypothetical protein
MLGQGSYVYVRLCPIRSGYVTLDKDRSGYVMLVQVRSA